MYYCIICQTKKVKSDHPFCSTLCKARSKTVNSQVAIEKAAKARIDFDNTYPDQKEKYLIHSHAEEAWKKVAMNQITEDQYIKEVNLKCFSIINQQNT